MRLKSFLQYFGAKSRLTQFMAGALPDMTGIDTVVSPFFGSGAFEYFLIETYNHIALYGYDIERELVNYHQCLIENPQKLYNEITDNFSKPLNKEQFLGYRKILTEQYIVPENRYYMAAVLFGLSRNSYSGKLRSFAKKPAITSVKYMNDYFFGEDNTTQGSIRVTCDNCFNVLGSVKDNPSTLIYLDPPYYIDGKPRLNHYGIICLQAPFDHIRLFNMLKVITTKWILSYNYSKYILDLYQDFYFHTRDVVYLRYTSDKTHSDIYKELVITNFKNN